MMFAMDRRDLLVESMTECKWCPMFGEVVEELRKLLEDAPDETKCMYINMHKKEMEKYRNDIKELNKDEMI